MNEQLLGELIRRRDFTGIVVWHTREKDRSPGDGADVYQVAWSPHLEESQYDDFLDAVTELGEEEFGPRKVRNPDLEPVPERKPAKNRSLTRPSDRGYPLPAFAALAFSQPPSFRRYSL